MVRFVNGRPPHVSADHAKPGLLVGGAPLFVVATVTAPERAHDRSLQVERLSGFLDLVVADA